jgi:hypothetical protein
MKVLKYIAFGVVYIVMLVKRAGLTSFIDAWNDTKKIITFE